jgi:hypothetical protein
MRAAATVGSARLIESGASRERWQGATGTLEMRWNSRGALEITVREHGGEDLVSMVTERMDKVLQDAGKIVLFFDFGEMQSYESVMRVRWTEWLKLHRPQIVSLHVVARSKLVAMGVSVANLALGGIITAHTGRQGAYETALQQASLSLHG